MAHHESDREDLLRQATALVERAELTIPGIAEPIVVGFRRDGSASFFFGADPVYQFNSAGELRRAYLNGMLYKADRGRLVKMRRERSPAEVALVSVELPDREAKQLIAEIQARVAELASALSGGRFSLIGHVPHDGNPIDRITTWLAAMPGEIRIADRPHAG